MVEGILLVQVDLIQAIINPDYFVDHVKQCVSSTRFYSWIRSLPSVLASMLSTAFVMCLRRVLKRHVRAEQRR